MTGRLAPGTILGDRYRIVRLLAEGGMGVVYEAEHLELGRRVAIKTLLAALQDQPRLIQRFIREARATCMISHSNVVSILDIDQTAEGLVYFVMEYLEGSDVSQVLEREGSIAWDRARSIALQVCDALAAAHDRGVVHRDLKPSNCFLVQDDDGAEHVKVLDFGIAKVLESSAPRAGPRGPGTGRDLRWLKTSTGEVFGTLAYMAPEHLNGDGHDHRVDIYAIGVILYEMLTGRTPFSPDAPGAFIQQVLFDPPAPPSQIAPNAVIPPDLDYVVLRTLEKRPEDRFRSMEDLANALSSVRLEAAPPITPTPWTAVPVIAPPIPAKLPVAAIPPPSRHDRRTWPWMLAGVGGLAVAAIVVRVALGTGDVTTSPPEQVSVISGPPARPPAPIELPVFAPPPVVPEAPAPAAAVVPEAPAPAAAVAPEAPAPPAVSATRAKTRPSSPRPRERDLPAMTVTPFERNKLFAPYRDAITARCKRPRDLENALLVLQVTIEAAQFVRVVLTSGPDSARQAAARCIHKYLRAQVQLPKSMAGRASFAYAF